MMPRRRLAAVLLVAAAAASLGACSTVKNVKLNPFKKDAPKAVASDGRRISIIAFDQKVEVSDSLKGVDFFLPPAAPQADWQLPGGNDEQSIEHVQAAPDFEIAWKRGYGKGSDRKAHVTAPPIMAAGKLYVMDGEATVAALDAQTGAIAWKTELKPKNKKDKDGYGGGVAFADGKVYVSSGFRLVAQLDAATGSVGWRQNTESPVHGAPTVSRGKVIAISTDDQLLTFDAASGAEGWNYQALTEPARILSASSPAVSGDTIVAAFASGEVVALRSANGNDLWDNTLSQASRTNALSEIRDIAGRPIIYKGDVFAASHSGVFAATDLRTGQARWSLPISSISTPWAAGDVVYVLSQAGEVICISRENGQVYWIKDLNAGIKKSKDRATFAGPILVSDRLVVVSSDGRALALNPKTGDLIKTLKLGAPALIAPIAAGNMIYVVTDDAQVVAIR